MLGKKEAKFIISLQKKKNREENRLYVIEGDKIVREFLNAGVPVRTLAGKPEFLNSLSPQQKSYAGRIIPVSYEELKKISTMKTPHNALAVVAMPETTVDISRLDNSLSVALDCVQEPGNMGTIIRSAVWFGITDIFCSEDCVDVYNPKVIQASMGSILHINVFYTGLPRFIEDAYRKGLRIFGAMIDGDQIYTHNLESSGIIILGNESKGISDNLHPFITDRITIPKFCSSGAGIESLNVSMAASVIFSEFARRRSIGKNL
jgi:TrmH family RNA methyltransferase